MEMRICERVWRSAEIMALTVVPSTRVFNGNGESLFNKSARAYNGRSLAVANGNVTRNFIFHNDTSTEFEIKWIFHIQHRIRFHTLRVSLFIINYTLLKEREFKFNNNFVLYY